MEISYYFTYSFTLSLRRLIMTQSRSSAPDSFEASRAFTRASGVLAPLFALPGVRDVGSLGSALYSFLDKLAQAGQTYWQILPINPTDAGGSPYAARSAFAGETLYLDLEEFYRQGLLDKSDLQSAWYEPHEPSRRDVVKLADARSEKIDYAHARATREPCWRKAYDRFQQLDAAKELRSQAQKFYDQAQDWLEDYALFQTASEIFHTDDWTKWPLDIRRRQRQALRQFASEYAERLAYLRFLQFAFHQQWGRLREECAARKIKILGDVPIYVGRNSADVWRAPKLFMVEEDGRVIREAGSPADDYNPDGQRWGAPTYRWSKHAETGFSWWKARIQTTLERFDLTRLDHFIGFYNYYSFSGDSQTTDAQELWEQEQRFAVAHAQSDHYEEGWVPGPQNAFFDAIFERFSPDAFIAEDLGVMNEGVCRLRDQYNLPGMEVLQFSFDNLFLDASDKELVDPTTLWKENSVAYTGTHDGAPILGWLSDVKRYGRRAWKSLDYNAVAAVLARHGDQNDSPAARVAPRDLKSLFDAIRYSVHYAKRAPMGVNTTLVPLERKIADLHMPALRTVAASQSKIAIFPLQDVVGLSNDSRINFPGVAKGNWTWRLAPEALTQRVFDTLATIARQTGRFQES